MDTNIAIAPYKNIDYDRLISIFNLNSPEFFAPEELKDFQNYLKNETEDYFVAKVANTIVGCGGINYIYESETAIISWDIVDPTFQGKGIGTKILEYRIALIKKNPNISKIMVRTSQVTYHYYEKNGFYIQKVIEKYWSPSFDLYEMRYQPKNL